MPDRGEQVEAVVATEPAAVEATDAAQATDAAEPTEAVAPVFEPDAVLLGAVDLARRALLDVTAPETVGSVIGHQVEDEHVLTLLFAADLGGYPGWRWSVTVARVDDTEPTVLETELMPGDSSLLAPEWIPWSERLADYRAAQEAAAAAAAEAAGDDSEGAEDADAAHPDDESDEGDLDEDEDDLDEDEDDLDEDEDDEEADLDDDAELDAAFGHDDGDDEFDGIDIDSLDDSAEPDAEESDESDSDEPDEAQPAEPAS